MRRMRAAEERAEREAEDEGTGGKRRKEVEEE